MNISTTSLRCKPLVLLLTLAWTTLACSRALAQYVRDGSIGRPATSPRTALTPTTKPVFPTLGIPDWKGQKLIFLPQTPSLRKYGYQRFRGGKGIYGQPTYAECAGKVATVLDVEQDISGDLVVYKIRLRLDDGGKVYVGEALARSLEIPTLDGVALLSDIKRAKDQWVGKKLWINEDCLLTYDATKDEHGEVPVRRLSAVTIVDVVAGTDQSWPVRFIVRSEDGTEGFRDTHISDTNIPAVLRACERFEDTFLTEDPKAKYHWPSEVWRAIERGEVNAGMTKEQVQLAWKTPTQIVRESTAAGPEERWVYSKDRYVAFTNNIVSKSYHKVETNPDLSDDPPVARQTAPAGGGEGEGGGERNQRPKDAGGVATTSDGFTSRNVKVTEGAAGRQIIGELTNQSGKDYEAAAFKVSLYDDHDALVEVVPVVVMGLMNRETKSFEGPVTTGGRISRVKIQLGAGY